MTERLARVAGAPVTWGVSEARGWGHQMSCDRVLREAASIGFRALELGPPGFLPSPPEAAKRMLVDNGLVAAGSFLAIVLHREAEAEAAIRSVAAALDVLLGAGGRVLVLAAALGRDDYEGTETLSPDEWRTLVELLAHARGEGARREVTVTLHPHHGTAIANAAEVERLLGSSEVALCVDTGHLMVAGADPLAVVRAAGPRVRHVHLKDVDALLAARVRSGELSYRAAVARGLYRPLGDGHAGITEVLERLESEGYGGWYVLEQDTVLEREPAPGEGPVLAAERSLRFLSEVLV